MVTIAWCADATEAELLCGALRDAGVPNAAVNQYTAALGPYSGGSQIEVQVPVEDRERAAEVLGLLFDRNDVDPEPEPADGSADFAIDEQGLRFPLVIVAEFATAREMLHASAHSARRGCARTCPTSLPASATSRRPCPCFACASQKRTCQGRVRYWPKPKTRTSRAAPSAPRGASTRPAALCLRGSRTFSRAERLPTACGQCSASAAATGSRGATRRERSK